MRERYHHTRRKNPFTNPRKVLQRAKKSLCNRSQFRTLLLPHRFIKIRPSHKRPVSIEFLTICRIPEFPKSEKIEKVAETWEFDGKEPLFFERNTAISIWCTFLKSGAIYTHKYIRLYIYILFTYIYTYISQNSYWDCYGSFEEQNLFSVKFARFRNFFDFVQIWGILQSDKLWEIQCWRVADVKDESW